MMYPIPLRVVQSNLTNKWMSHSLNMPNDSVHSRKKTFASLPDEMLLQIIDLLSLTRLDASAGHLDIFGDWSYWKCFAALSALSVK
jgi:hypothetical protein